jgi:Fe-S cluster assembly iron-binding protein IscA
MIRISPEALDRLMKARPDDPGYGLRIIVMDEGCGCGAPLLYDLAWDFKGPGDVSFDAGPFQILIERGSIDYLDDPTYLVYDEQKAAYRLYSNNQIYNNEIVF